MFFTPDMARWDENVVLQQFVWGAWHSLIAADPGPSPTYTWGSNERLGICAQKCGGEPLSARCIQKRSLISRAILKYLMPCLSFIILLESFMEFDLWGNQLDVIIPRNLLDVA